MYVRKLYVLLTSARTYVRTYVSAGGGSSRQFQRLKPGGCPRDSVERPKPGVYVRTYVSGELGRLMAANFLFLVLEYSRGL